MDLVRFFESRPLSRLIFGLDLDDYRKNMQWNGSY
jgi:hypothetical protein